MNIIITRNGDVRYLAVPGSECFETLGQTHHRRVSHILPKPRLKRWAFLALRWAFGDSGRVAAWRRSWQTTWTVRWAETPNKIEFEHISRRVCLRWEQEKVEERYANS